MRVHQERIAIPTPGAGLHDVSREIAAVVARAGVTTGMVTVFVQHTSASLLIQENASPDVQHDLIAWMSELAPEGRRWRHDEEGPDDMPAHARAALTRTSENIPVTAGKLALGTWQALYLWEHRRRPHTRSLIVHVVGE